MSLVLTPVTRRRDLRTFIHLPAAIHRHHLRWIPPLYADEWKYFSAKKNGAFSYCDTILLLARNNGNAVGRIMGIINHRYNDSRGEKTARFAYWECYEDQEVAHQLLCGVEDWAREKGVNKLVGPLGFGDQDPEGYLVEGFDFEPTLATYYNYEYLIRFLQSGGYSKEVDYVVYKVPVQVPEFYQRIHDRIAARSQFALLEFARRKDLKPYIHPVLRLMNETFQDLYGYVPLDNKEMTSLAKRYLPVLDPRFVKIVLKDRQVVAFILGIPNLNEGIRQSKGHLLPFGIFQIIRAAKRSKQLDLLLGAIKPEYRGRGVDVLLAMAMINSAMTAGFEFMDSHHELETNIKTRTEMERAGGHVYKRFRIFRKQL